MAIYKVKAPLVKHSLEPNSKEQYLREQLESLRVQIQLNAEENHAILHDEQFCHFYRDMGRLTRNNEDIYELVYRMFTALEQGVAVDNQHEGAVQGQKTTILIQLAMKLCWKPPCIVNINVHVCMDMSPLTFVKQYIYLYIYMSLWLINNKHQLWVDLNDCIVLKHTLFQAYISLSDIFNMISFHLNYTVICICFIQF